MTTPTDLRAVAEAYKAGAVEWQLVYAALRSAADEIERYTWQPIETAPKATKLVVAYQNQLGNWRRVLAAYYLPETLESEHDESGWAEEGWYELTEAYEELAQLEHEPIHWMPLPKAPT